MNHNDNNNAGPVVIFTFVCILAIFCMILGKFFGYEEGKNKIMNDAIKNNVAYWHPQTKEFCWYTNKLEAIEIKK